MQPTKEQLKESYKNLPQDVRNAIFSIDTANVLRQIGDEKKMMIDKIGELADETGLVLLGFTHPSQFVSHLSERLGIEKSIAKEIAEEVNTKIFFPIRENLKKIHGLREEEVEREIETEKTPFPTPPSPVMPSAPAPTPEKTEIGPRPTSLGLEIPTAPTPSPLPSALIPEPVVLETTLPKESEIKTPPQSEAALPETPVQPVTSIFEAKTKEEGFRLPAEATEKKIEPSFMKAPESKKIDPYREPTI